MTLPVFVPHTKINEATRNFLAQSQVLGRSIQLVDVGSDSLDYINYMRDRWREGHSFINIEHDVVPWPGALESLEDCSQEWCSFAYDTAAKDFLLAPLGLAKLSFGLIQALPGVWEGDLPWHELDAHLYRYATDRGHTAHQHRPSVLNANHYLLDSWRRAGLTEL